jgi:hypothetical protein
MSNDRPLSEFLVLSRGHWDPDKSAEQIQQAIDAFYVWHENLVLEGRARPGQRLARDGKFVSPWGVTDGPFAESKEVIGGYWFFLAQDLDEAAALAAQNPCIQCGLSYEVRPTDPERGSAYKVTSETPNLPR